MKRVLITEPVIKAGGIDYYQGDVMTLQDHLAETFISAGWAKCFETGESGERSTDPIDLDVDSVRQKISCL